MLFKYMNNNKLPHKYYMKRKWTSLNGPSLVCKVQI